MLLARALGLGAAAWLFASPLAAQGVPPAFDARLDSIARAPRPAQIEQDVRALAGFGTRNTFSDTVSQTRGIGAARRWLVAEFQRISAACGNCLEVRYQQSIVKGQSTESRTTPDVNVVNVVAIQRGSSDANHMVVMSGDIDSRNSTGTDTTKDAPGANDNASGLAGVLEAARTLTRYAFGKTIVYTGLSGEEQGEVKKVARDLLPRLKELLVLNWRGKASARSQIKLAIEDILDSGLPRVYTPDVYQQKCSALFEHVYESYPERDHGVYATTA